MANAVIVRCNSCGAIYKPVQDDGTEYYHACPTHRLLTAAVVDQDTGKVITPAVLEKIANRRDENVHRVDDKGVVTIKSQGAGVTPVFDPAVIAAAGFAGEDA